MGWWNADSPVFIAKGHFRLPKLPFTYAKLVLLHCNGLCLDCKTTTIGVQKGSFWWAKGVLLEGKRGPFALLLFSQWSRNRRNQLCIRHITKTAQNSRIPHQRFPCAFNSQFWAVRNANIVFATRFLSFEFWVLNWSPTAIMNCWIMNFQCHS